MAALVGKPIVRIDRQDFIANYWDYKPGQHVCCIGETGNGKTTLMMQLLKATSHSPRKKCQMCALPGKPVKDCIGLPSISLVMKPRDETVDKYAREVKEAGLEYRKVHRWPPSPSLWAPGTPDGWFLWPKHTADPDVDEWNHAEIYRTAMMHSYKKGNRIIFADEAYSLDEELKLARYMNTLWTKGRSMGTGMWAATQQPAWVPTNMYRQTSHAFLSWATDKRSRDRYKEIGGVEPQVMERALWQASEEEFAWVYALPNGRRSKICIVGA